MKVLSQVFFGVVIVTVVTLAALLSLTPTTKQTADMSVHASRPESTDDDPLSQTTASESTGPASLGYVMANHYGGQQGAGVRSLASLQCLIGSYGLPVRILEPFALGSYASDFPLESASTPLTFGDLFDLQRFNKLSRQEAEPALASWDDFVENAPRNVIFIGAHKEKVKKIEFELHGDVKKGVGIDNMNMGPVRRSKQQCFSAKYTSNKQLSKHGFCVVRIVHLKLPNTNQMVTDDNLYKYLYGDWDPRHTTLVISRWGRTAWVQNPSTLNVYNCSNLKWNRIEHRLRPSQRLLNDAQFYIKHYLHSSIEATVMVRSEHVLLPVNSKSSIQKKIRYFKSCLQSATDIVKELNITKGDHVTYLTVDISTYGSKSSSYYLGADLYNESYKLMESTITKFYRKEMSLKDWEESFLRASGGEQNPSYIAALQRTIASQTKCLILVGGGNFQYLAVREYLRLHPNPDDQCIHTVCLRESFTEVLNY